MGLFTPIWMQDNLEGKKREKAKKKIDGLSFDKLKKAALRAPESGIRKAAVEKLTDQAVLAEVALKDEYSYVRTAAVKKLTNQAALAQFALKDEYYYVRKAAVEKLTDQTVLAEVALNDKNEDVRKAAVEKLTDQAVLAEVALKDEYKDVRASAVEGLAKLPCNTDLFYKIALSNRSNMVFGAAFNTVEHVIIHTKVEEADILSDDMVACMIIAMENKGAYIREWPIVSKKIVLFLKALYREGKLCSSIEALNGKSYRNHTDYHADCSCASWGHEDVNYIFELDNKQ